MYFLENTTGLARKNVPRFNGWLSSSALNKEMKVFFMTSQVIWTDSLKWIVSFSIGDNLGGSTLAYFSHKYWVKCIVCKKNLFIYKLQCIVCWAESHSLRYDGVLTEIKHFSHLEILGGTLFFQRDV